MRAIAALLFILVACQNPAGQTALPDAESPKDVAVNYVELLRQNHCETALAYTAGSLKSTYQKMIDGKNFSSACESWRAQYLPYSSVEVSHEEVLSEKRKKVWLRLYKDQGGVFDVFSVEVEQLNGRWWVVAV